ncbi:MAG: hypothetical protein M3Q48_15530 [Actinomycetota bacterium]|nr:hypothetical protein [Actinomycetota bacterium]
MLHSVVLLIFDDPAGAGNAMAELRRLDDDTVSVKTAVHVERTTDGHVAVHDDADVGFLGTALGGALGALAGALTGPVGLVLGAGTGMAAGSLLDANEAGLSEVVVATAMRHVPPGATAVVADVVERDPQLLDAVAVRTGAAVVRTSRLEVEEELAAVETARAVPEGAAGLPRGEAESSSRRGEVNGQAP